MDIINDPLFQCFVSTNGNYLIN